MMKDVRRYWRGVVIVLGFMVLATIPLAQAEAKPKVFTLDSVPFGRTYSDWSAAWWQWALSIPVPNHPLFDNGDCSVGQTGPVWFLGGKFCRTGDTGCVPSPATRTCTVPAGKALYFPILNVEDSMLEDPGKTIVELRAVAEPVIDLVTNLAAEVDRMPIRDLEERFRVQSTVFDFTLPADNLFSAIGEGPFAAGAYFPAADEGIYLMLAPLPVGNHVVHFHAEIPDFNFTLDITYNLTVAP